MSTEYDCRKVCETETGDGKGFHFYRWTDVDVTDESTPCPDHPTAATRDFVIEEKRTT
jgi:hypothetical protein